MLKTKSTIMKTTLLVFALISTFSFGQNQITWGTTGDVSTPSFGNYFPRVVSDATGDPMVSWSGNSDMYFSRWNGASFTSPITLNTNGTSIAGATWMGPDIASKGDTVFAVYKVTPEADSNSHVWCTGSFDGGVTFSTPIRVDYIGDNICRFPTVSIDNQGNPIVGFMRFDAGFGNARWVVAKSNDLGLSFSNDVLASGWSDPTSEVCDCCPSKIVSEGNNVAMPYRDNDNNIRDTWVGVSNDGGTSFANGMDVDQQGWFIMACPSSGPDAVIVGDDLYTTYMSSATGSSRVSYNVSSISSMIGSAAIPLDQTTPTSLTSQNYPRVDYNGNSMAFAWKQFSNGTQELAIQFTENITTGLNTIQEIVDIDNVGTVDVMLFDGMIWVVWEDVASGTVKYRSGTYTSFLGIENLSSESILVNVQPNPSSSSWNISVETTESNLRYELISASGQVVEENTFEPVNGSFNFKINNSAFNSGIYYLKVVSDGNVSSLKLVKL